MSAPWKHEGNMKGVDKTISTGNDILEVPSAGVYMEQVANSRAVRVVAML